MPRHLMGEHRWDELRELHTQGLGRNAIAKAMGVNDSTVSRTAAHLGLSFDRSKIQPAMNAIRADIEERRMWTALELQEVIEDSLKRIYEPTTVYSFGGKDNTYEDHVFDEAPIAERVKLLTAVGIAVDKQLKLLPPAAASDLDGAKSMLGNLGELLTAFSRQQDEAEQAESDEA